MQRPHRGWYLVIAVVALIPVGMRAVTMKRAKPVPVDLAMAKEGEILFNHQWTVNDPLTHGGDGLGPVFNANSCVACHSKGGVGGSGGTEHNVTLFTIRNGNTTQEGVVHASAISEQFKERLSDVSAELPQISQPTVDQVVRIAGRSNKHCIPTPNNVALSQRNTPALFGAKLIDDIPDRVILAMEKSEHVKWGMASSKDEDLPVGRALRLANGKVGHFGWKAQSATLSDFVQAACANELGLGNPGQAQPASLRNMSYKPKKDDLTQEQCDQLTAFCASLPRPSERSSADSLVREKTVTGKKLFHNVGCADCHTPDLGSVEAIYSDLLLHRMGEELVGGGSYNEPPRPPSPRPDGTPGQPPSPGEWRTPPLWGVADSAPYLHDGRAATLHDAIVMHGGQGLRSAQKYQELSKEDQSKVIEFLNTLKAP